MQRKSYGFIISFPVAQKTQTVPATPQTTDVTINIPFQECVTVNINPVAETPIIPGIVAPVFDIPIIIPVYAGAIS